MLPIHHVLRLILLVVPKDTDIVTPVHDELVTTTTSRVLEPPPQVLLLGELIDVRRRVGVVDSAFTSIALDVGHLVHAHRVLLVERRSVELARGGCGLSGRRVFNEGKPSQSGQHVFPTHREAEHTAENSHRHPWACGSCRHL